MKKERWLNIQKRGGSESGAAMLEFVISFLPFFVVLSGAFGMMQLAFYYGTVEFMANEAALLATLPGTTVADSPDPTNPAIQRVSCNTAAEKSEGRACRVYERLRALAPGKAAIYLTSTIGGPCAAPAAIRQNMIKDIDGSSLNPVIPLGGPRDLVSFCVSVQVNSLPFNLLPIPVHLSGVAVGRNEPNV